ncbi:hypothetical protein DSCO28_68330 [Desulfosarcina ovata subsp. sediminis]|uniref:Uncharacterized protein n=1 Tax=Desulfosarcina ovata subsp. sediminis TaxID=885957 RepID=A0A5K8A1B9_9BACT|nr:hypothetical protein DSCO28_68330 [Desulfosarcina ovata subsp. sediminis]
MHGFSNNHPMDCESNDPENKKTNQMATNGCDQTALSQIQNEGAFLFEKMQT